MLVVAIYMHLIDLSYIVTQIIKKSSLNYWQARDDWTSWCEFFLVAVESQAIRNLEIAERISRLYDEMKNKFSSLLASKWSVIALDFMFTNPVFRNNKFTNFSGIPTPTAARFTRLLLENDLIVLAGEASGRRPALYRFEPLMEFGTIFDAF